MAALNFPSSPTIGDEYTANGSVWQWDGTSWNINVTTGLNDFSPVVTATSVTAAASQFIIVTAATQTITLPASPANGDMVGISVGAFTDTVVGRNGNNISGDASDITIDVANAGVILIYSSSTTDWRII